MKDEIVLSKDQIKQQLVMQNKMYNLVGCKALFKMRDGQYTGVVKTIQYRTFDFVHLEDNKEVKQHMYLVNGFILENEMYIPVENIVQFVPLT